MESLQQPRKNHSFSFPSVTLSLGKIEATSCLVPFWPSNLNKNLLRALAKFFLKSSEFEKQKDRRKEGKDQKSKEKFPKKLQMEETEAKK